MAASSAPVPRGVTVGIAVIELGNDVVEVGVLAELDGAPVPIGPVAPLDISVPKVKEAIDLATERIGRQRFLDGWWSGYVQSVNEDIWLIAATFNPNPG